MKTQRSCFTSFLFAISLFFASEADGQLKSFGSGSRHKSPTYYTLTVYGYYDMIREAGLGLQWQTGPNVSIDASVFSIRPNSSFKKIVHQWDYYDFQGIGLSIKPKWHIDLRGGFYVGFTYSIEYLEHNTLPVAYYHGRGTEFYYDHDECYGYASTLGANTGYKLCIKRLSLEPFGVLGLTSARLKRITHSSTTGYNRSNYPSTTNDGMLFFNLNIGIKIGIGFKRSKKHRAIDEKFDKSFLPRYAALDNYLGTMDERLVLYPKPMYKAYRKMEKANRAFLRIYKQNYRDTVRMYRKMEDYFGEIDRLIMQGKGN